MGRQSFRTLFQFLSSKCLKLSHAAGPFFFLWVGYFSFGWPSSDLGFPSSRNLQNCQAAIILKILNFLFFCLTAICNRIFAPDAKLFCISMPGSSLGFAYLHLKTARELLSNSLPHGSWDQMLEYISDQVIKQKTKPRQKQQIDEPVQSPLIPSPMRENISSPIKRAIFARDQVCQYQDPKSKGKRESKWNLRLLCAAHNLTRYREQAGIE